MIVWGGSGDHFFQDGGRYIPAENRWKPTPTNSTPRGRTGQTSVWTGSEMLIWGGDYFEGANDNYLGDGGRYDPAANNWTSINTSGAPHARTGHSGVWTGTEMLIWGGYFLAVTYVFIPPYPFPMPIKTDVYFNDGARYDPVSDTWTAITTNGAPAARSLHGAVWTGIEMIIWGGKNSFNDGGRYNPVNDSWTRLATTAAPSARTGHSSVWTGSEMIVWGGYSASSPFYLNDGGRYNPASNTWTLVTTTSAPSGRQFHSTVWTGSQMLLWGGNDSGRYLNDGGRYDPAVDIWTGIATNGAPAGRSGQTAAWTGSEMIVWGGYNGPGSFNVGGLNDGGRYDPASNSWSAMSTNNAPTGRYNHTAIWTGSDMLIWGGIASGTYFADNWSYTPSPPRLALVLNGNNKLDVSWAFPSTGFGLEQNPALGGTNWRGLSNAPVHAGDRWHVPLQPPDGTGYYRLRKP
jgi:N-acetylneuraminic acid mutarotase